MENPGELMAIKAFAAAAGRTQQAIYKQIGTRLAPYVHEKDGQKYLERRALREIFNIDDIEGVKPEQPKENNFVNSENNPENPLYAILKAELDAKNRQIEQLQEELAKERQHSRELVDDLAKLADQAQKLHAGTIQAQLPPAEPIADRPAEPAAEEDPVEAPDPTPAEPERKSFGGWLRSIFG